MNTTILYNCLGFLGVGLISLGTFLIYVPAGFIVAGIALVIVARNGFEALV